MDDPSTITSITLISMYLASQLYTVRIFKTHARITLGRIYSLKQRIARSRRIINIDSKRMFIPKTRSPRQIKASY